MSRFNLIVLLHKYDWLCYLFEIYWLNEISNGNSIIMAELAWDFVPGVIVYNSDQKFNHKNFLKLFFS